MKRTALSSLTALALLCAASPARAEKTVSRKDLPAPVEKTVARETAGDTLKGISSEPCDDGGKGVCYEVETMRGGRSRDLVIDASGAIVEVEEGVAPADLPSAVTRAGESLGRIARAEKVTRGAETSYELLIEKAGRKSERTFLADGIPKK